MSLRLRVVLAVALLLLSGSIVGTGLAGWQAGKGLHEELVAALAGGRQTVAGGYEMLARSDDPARDVRRLVTAFNGDRHLQAAFFDAGGRLRSASHPLPAARAPAWFAG